MLQNDSAHGRLWGIGFISLMTLCFAALDASAKLLVQTLPVFEVVWLRFASHVLLATSLLGPRYGRQMVATRQPRLQLLRSVFQAGMTALNFWALQYLALTVTGAIQFSVPIIIALISARWLGERLDTKRWLAVLTGFGGVLVIVRPGTEAFHPAVFLSLGNAILYALSNLLTRRLAETDAAVTTQLLSALGALVWLTPLAWLEWQTPHTWQQWALVVSAGLFGGMGHWAQALAHRYASASVLGPFMYQQIIYMALLGWFIFGTTPDLAVVLGAVIVIGSGLYLAWRALRQSR
jgi:drug/metabolite transporter (DMT)-like permease